MVWAKNATRLTLLAFFLIAPILVSSVYSEGAYEGTPVGRGVAEGVCGDIEDEPDGDFGLQDFVRLVDYLLIRHAPLLDSSLADVDDWQGITMNDAAVMAWAFSTGQNLLDCIPDHQGPFPVSSNDSLQLRNLSIPPNQATWSVELWAKTSQPYNCIFFPFRYGSLGSTLRLDTIVWAIPNNISPYLHTDMAGNEAFCFLSFTQIDDSVWHQVASFYFSNTMSADTQRIWFDTASYQGAHNLLVSRDGGSSPVMPTIVDLFSISDSDGDGTADRYDNCPALANSDQSDRDSDGLGDICDNCPDSANVNQSDRDGDGIGDVCDQYPDDDDRYDEDFDGVPDGVDNCPTVANLGQDDQDADGVGDVCDECTDTDGDGYGDSSFTANTCPTDNCPNDPNPDQLDSDGDGIGDACGVKCGEVEDVPDGRVDLQDLVRIIDYLLLNYVPLVNPTLADVDNWEGITMNDASLIAYRVFDEQDVLDCTPDYSGPFPASSDDSLELRNLTIPPNQDSWTVELWLKASEPYKCVFFPFTFGSSGLAPELISITNHLDDNFISSLLADDAGVEAYCALIIHQISTTGWHQIASFTFTNTLSPDTQRIWFDTASYQGNHTLLLSRDGGLTPVRPAIDDLISVTDYDSDGVADRYDNCPYLANADQSDTDGDNRGDICDNCPDSANTDQSDRDADGIGDVCDLYPDANDNYDEDSDGVPDGADNCPLTANADQSDLDRDGIGDICDDCTDVDHDGFGDSSLSANTCPPDNCLLKANPDQSDRDGDGIGDLCDLYPDDNDNYDEDSDGVPDGADNCMSIANSDQADADLDGIGDVCDECTDVDGDGFGDTSLAANTCPPDNCIYAANPDQSNRDGDALGDVCDNCPDTASLYFNDRDGDGIGDICDNCPTRFNPDQVDSDSNGIGDLCEGVCGDVWTPLDGLVNLMDIAAIFGNLLYTRGPFLYPEWADLDGWPGITMNDAAALTYYIYEQGPSPNCTPYHQGPFPLSAVDTLEVRNLVIPPFQDSWTVELWIKPSRPYNCVLFPCFAYSSNAAVTFDSARNVQENLVDVIGNPRMDDNGVRPFWYLPATQSHNLDWQLIGRLYFSNTMSTDSALISIDTAAYFGTESVVLSCDGGQSPVVPTILGLISSTGGNCCVGVRGDVDGDGKNGNLSDVTYLIDHVYITGRQLSCPDEANIDGDPQGQITLNDVTSLIDYAYISHKAPLECGQYAASSSARISETDAVSLLSQYDGQSTVVILESLVDLRGIHLELTDQIDVQVIQLTDSVSVFVRKIDPGKTIIGLFDPAGKGIIPAGRRELIRIPGRHELSDALASDMNLHLVYPGIEATTDLPSDFALSQNYPNPFNPITEIQFTMPLATAWELTIYNVLGQTVASWSEQSPAGTHTVTWDAHEYSSGVYFYRLTAGPFTETKKMLLLK